MSRVHERRRRAGRQEGLHLRAARRAVAAAEARAFDRRGGGGEADRLALVLPFRESEREGPVPDVAGAERVDRLDRESRLMRDHAAVPEEHAGGAVRHREPARGGRQRLEPGTQIVGAAQVA